ncbi:COG3497 Phage tail sheath protein FI [uncultured Caudovirales phage]|uniref:COG3497 Phage tail sheath protein FI n=1 Tax=uncultured Caudovirales phage TaxID=2100421 RepID=A0A6J5MTA1_9CAUD|nr:COG3497 Phage tail sheath protein FI [uncultured Caudovirales phage]CAB4158161.1 COG3497 Phage tail sheath protein FI [uncultured Caudovirales phage]
MSFQRPGVYVQETLNPVQSTTGPNSDSIGAFIGANDRGPTRPTLVTSWSDYVTKFGSWNTTASNNLPLAVYMFFSNGGSRAYVTRVVATAVKATRSFNDTAGTPIPTLSLTAVNEGTWGNSLNVTFSASTTTGLFDAVIYYGGNTDAFIVEKFTDLSMTATNTRYAVSVINNTSAYVTATDLGSASTGATRNPSFATANQALSTGTNGSAISTITSYSTFDTIKQSLILNVPGFTDATTINAAISYAAAREDVFVVIDGMVDTVANQLTRAAAYTASSYAAVYYPQISIADPTLGVGGATNSTRIVGAGAAVAGLYSSTDASRGVFKAPAGLQARLAGAVAVPVLTNDELDSLNAAAAPVNAIKFVSGSGIVVMGAKTLKPGYIDKYVPVRRTLIYLRKALTDLTEFAIFEPNDTALWRRLDSTVSSFLTNFWSQGGLAGTTPASAFFVKVDATNNPQSSIDNGEVNIEVGVALQRPAEFVIIKIGQFDGGTTVTVA